MATTHYKRTAHRWNLLVVMVVGVFFAFGSFWLLQLMQASDPDGQLGGLPNEPDYIVENFSFVRMTENGQPSYLISGKRLEHIPEGDVSYVDTPLLRGVEPGRPPMTVNAKNARIHHQEHRVELMGDVDLQRPKTAAAEALHVRTQALTVLPDEEILKTDQPVDMQLGASTVKGTGMIANNATQKLHLSSRGQIVYPPRPR
jgi:lipopolysaccharide export system protein LptC